MGKCFSCMKRKTQPRREITVAILGLDNAGKTTATKAMLGETLEAAPTIGFTSENFTLDKFQIKIFDLGGGNRIRNIWKQYFVEVYGVIYVVDSSQPERIQEARTSLKEILEHPKIGGKPLLVLANKQDQADAMDEVDICEQLTLEDLVNANKCPCRIETCSAIKGTGRKMDPTIKNGLRWMCATIDLNWSVYQPRIEEDMKEEAERKQKEMMEKRERVRKIREERERKEEEERKRLGIEKPPSDDEEDIDGDPFKPVDINALNEKEKRMKEEKKKRKELEMRMFGQDTNQNNINEDSDGELKSSRSLKYLGLTNGIRKNDNLFYNGNGNIEHKTLYDSDEDIDLDPTSKKGRRATPRLPPLQKPLGTKFSPEEQSLGKKKRKKKKLKALQENVEESDDRIDSQPSKYSAQSVSTIMVSTKNSNPDLENQISIVSKPNKHIVIGKTLSLDNTETEEEITPRSLQKKKKKAKSKGIHRSFDDFPTPRSLEAADDNAEFAGSLSYKVDNEENQTKIRKLKKKAYLKRNKTAPSDDEVELGDTLRDSNIKDFSWTISSPKKDVLSSEEEPVSRNWGFAEDLGDTVYHTPSKKIGRQPNYDEEDDILL